MNEGDSNGEGPINNVIVITMYSTGCSNEQKKLLWYGIDNCELFICSPTHSLPREDHAFQTSVSESVCPDTRHRTET